MLSTIPQSQTISAAFVSRQMEQVFARGHAASLGWAQAGDADGVIHGWSYLLDDQWEPRVFWRGDLREPAVLEACDGAPGQYVLTVGVGAGERWVCVDIEPTTPEGALDLWALLEQLLLERRA